MNRMMHRCLLFSRLIFKNTRKTSAADLSWAHGLSPAFLISFRFLVHLKFAEPASWGRAKSFQHGLSISVWDRFYRTINLFILFSIFLQVLSRVLRSLVAFSRRGIALFDLYTYGIYLKDTDGNPFFLDPRSVADFYMIRRFVVVRRAGRLLRPPCPRKRVSLKSINCY